MGRFDDLISDQCPRGVEYEDLQTIFITRNGYTPSKSVEANWTSGTIPWFRMEDIRDHGRVLGDSIQKVASSALKGGSLFPANSVIVATSATIGEHALITVPHLSNQRFTSLSLKPQYAEKFDIKFIYYYCFVLDEWCKKNTTVSSFASVDMVGFKKFRFPVPPLEVQREIVKVLDTFTELEAELEAELESRRRQYAHYRNTLFSLPDSGCRSVRILDVAEVRSGWGFPIAEQGNPGGTLPFYKVSDMNSVGNETFMSSANNYIDTSTAARLGVKAAPAGTVIFPKIGAAVGTNKKRMLSVESAYDNNVMGLIPAPLIRSGYLFHWLQTFDLLQVANDSGAVPSIRKSDMEQILIPLPDIAEQDRIVGILDKFDALVNDLTTGLPAELQARRQQYEHYRDKLLTFDEVAS